MKIEINNRTKSKINLNLVKRIVTEFARVYPVKSPLKRGEKQFNGVNKIGRKEISIAFVGDAEIKEINQAYRKINQPTDILTFQGEDDYLGELVIDYSQIKRQAGEFSHSAEEELIFILVHGLLHLIGYNDETDKTRRKMIELGEEFIKESKIK